jgi:hypothetical protein
MATVADCKIPIQTRPHGSRFHHHSDGLVTYTVQSGDTLSTIALAAFEFTYGRTPDPRELLNAVLQIDATNTLRGHLRAGQVLEWERTFNQLS